MECPECGRPVVAGKPRCLYCGATAPAGAVPKIVAGALPARDRGASGACVVLLVGRGKAGPEPDATTVALAAVLGDPHAARQMRARAHASVVHFADPDAARELLARVREAGLPVVAFADDALDAIPAAEIALAVEAIDGEACSLRVDLGDAQHVLAPSDLGLVVVGRVMEDGPSPRHGERPDPLRRRGRYGGGIAGALAGLAAEAMRGEPASEHATAERRLVVDLHFGDAGPIRIVEGRTAVDGPGFPAAPRYATHVALVRWLEQCASAPRIDRGYDELVRFTEFERPESRLAFDLYSARARLIESLRVKHGL